MKGFMRMKEALVDISVLLIFFTRHEQFAQVFEQVACFYIKMAQGLEDRMILST